MTTLLKSGPVDIANFANSRNLSIDTVRQFAEADNAIVIDDIVVSKAQWLNWQRSALEQLTAAHASDLSGGTAKRSAAMFRLYMAALRLAMPPNAVNYLRVRRSV